MNKLDSKLRIDHIEKSNFLLLKTVMDLLPNPMSIKNSRLERIAVNQAFVDISGYSKDKLLGASKLDIQSAETKTSIDYDKQVLLTKQSNKHTEKIVDSHGESRWVEIQKSFFKTEAGDDHVISILTDITELKQREFELVHSKKRTFQKSQQRSRFLANMGHDIREPLRGIMGMTSLLRNSSLDAHQTQAVALLGRAGDSLMRVLDDVIDFAKIDAGVMSVERSAFDLRELVEDLGDILGLSARDSQIDLIVSIDPHLPKTFIGDTVRIRQILTNLIENAIKFTSQGFVSMNVSGQTRNNMAKLEFTVKDTGTGIPPEKLKSLFQSVENDETSQRISGISGLGISLCQKLAMLMGGSLGANSVEGIGSEFTFTIPLEFQAESETNSAIPKSDASILSLLDIDQTASRRLLFVDDIKENYDAIAPHLNEHGFATDYAQSAASAVELLNNALVSGRPYSMVFIDYLMPVTDGLLLTGSLRRSQNYSNISIVALASVNDSEVEECFSSQSVTDYLTKPIHRSHIDSFMMNTVDVSLQKAS